MQECHFLLIQVLQPFQHYMLKSGCFHRIDSGQIPSTNPQLELGSCGCVRQTMRFRQWGGIYGELQRQGEDSV